MPILFLLGENPPQERRNAQGGEDCRAEATGVDLLWSCSAGKLITGRSIATQRRKSTGGCRVGCNFAGGHTGSAPLGSQDISQQNQAVGPMEGQWAQQNPLD